MRASFSFVYERCMMGNVPHTASYSMLQRCRVSLEKNTMSLGTVTAGEGGKGMHITEFYAYMPRVCSDSLAPRTHLR